MSVQVVLKDSQSIILIATNDRHEICVNRIYYTKNELTDYLEGSLRQKKQTEVLHQILL